MTTLRILYQQANGVAAIIVPTPDCELSIQEIARKDVPAGLPYKIIEDADIPEDRTFRNAWECVIESPDGYGIGQIAWFTEQENKQ